MDPDLFTADELAAREAITVSLDPDCDCEDCYPELTAAAGQLLPDDATSLVWGWGDASEQAEEQLRERIANVIAEHVELPNGGLDLLNAIMEEIEWDSVILPADEYEDIQEMCRLAMHVGAMAREWAASESE